MPLEMRVEDLVPCNRAEVALCESAYQVVSTWLWLSLRFTEACPDRSVAEVRCFCQHSVHRNSTIKMLPAHTNLFCRGWVQLGG